MVYHLQGTGAHLVMLRLHTTQVVKPFSGIQFLLFGDYFAPERFYDLRGMQP